MTGKNVLFWGGCDLKKLGLIALNGQMFILLARKEKHQNNCVRKWK